METREVRKECKPNYTIKRIRKLLRKNRINTRIKVKYRLSKHVFSLRIEIKGFKNLGANGKGITYRYALASAYGELMERLQSGLLIRKSFLLKKSYLNEISTNQVYENRVVILKWLSKVAPNENTYHRFYDFVYNNPYFTELNDVEELTTNKMEKLPYKIINMITHSNGLCAGNTKKEAIVQGICEILERFCYKSILNGKTIKTIKYKNNLVEEIEKLGFICLVKDCSLNRFPVIGVLILNREKTKYSFAVGSDPNIDIAIQRCITEIFQGLSLNKFFKKMKSIETNYEYETEDFKKLNWLKQFTANDGLLPKSVVLDDFVEEKVPPFFIKGKSTEICYEYLINILIYNKLPLYCQNLSLIGFDTYKLYIPTLSEVEWPSKEELFCTENYDFLQKILFSIDWATLDDIKFFINSFLPLIETRKYQFISPANYFHTENYVSCDLDKISFAALILILSMKINDYSIAQKICLMELDSNFVDKKEKSFFDKILKHIITLNAGEKSNMNFNLNLPTCPFCYKCICKKKCSYSKWNNIAEILYKNR